MERLRLSFTIPEDFRTFMRQVVVRIDWHDEGGSLEGAAAMQTECGHGGQIEPDRFQFVYLGKDGRHRWVIKLSEQQIRQIALGQLEEVDADQEELGPDPSTRTASGEALLVWGEYGDDAMRVRTQRELGVALDALHAMAEAPETPQTLRLWSTADDQLFAVIYGDQCAIYVIDSEHGYGTSAGELREESFEVFNADAGTLVIPWADCVAWETAKKALLLFAETGQLGEGIQLDGRIQSPLLILGECNRATELETRPAPPADPARTSLLRVNPYAQWARRLIDHMRGIELIELLDTAHDHVLLQLAHLLHLRGSKALDSPRVAERLSKEIGAIRGVDRLYATGSDLQVALRRTTDMPLLSDRE